MFKLKNENLSSTGEKLKFNFSPVLRAMSIIPNPPSFHPYAYKNETFTT